ncbi:beta-phosphoglucomutase [Jeotgalibaca sp. A127]|uniref:beta-phosphoglucomutase n=1 Tax=Jeotgalibaca sp. A127 TaxID=3457324 RepID=UPI003FD39EC5
MVLKGVIFDLDGVLTDTAEFHFRAWQDLGEKIDISFDRAFNENLKGISRMDSLDRILEHGGKKDVYSIEEKESLAKEKNDDYVELIKEITPADILPGVKKFLDDCREAGLKLGLASASKNGPAILKNLGLTDYFEVVVDPASLTNGKPDPEIFLKGAELLGLDPSECVGVEDAEAGIASINSAGMFSVGVGSPESMKQADLFVEETIELDLDAIIKAHAARG